MFQKNVLKENPVVFGDIQVKSHKKKFFYHIHSNYYTENRSDCYLLLLDASKAFDRVKYVKLSNILRDRGLYPIVLRLIMNMYTNQEIQVKWNTLLSSKCKARME